MEFDFDDKRILDGKVSEEEISALEEMLMEMFLKKAQALGKPIQTIRNWTEYNEMFKAGKPFEDFCLYIDNTEKVGDMRPVAYHLLDTDEGRFYAKLFVMLLA